MSMLHTIAMSTVSSGVRTEDGIFLACGAVAGTFKRTGGVILRLASRLFFAPALLEIGRSDGASELYICGEKRCIF